MGFDSKNSAAPDGRPGTGHATIRAFVCTSLSNDGMEEIVRFIGGLKKFSGFKWVAKDTLHITLKFLGETKSDQITRLDTHLSRIGGFSPFGVTMSGVGAFPDLSSPRVLWMGVGEGKGQLIKLAASVDRAALASGFEEERRTFHPHLTLARARTGSPPHMPAELAEMLKSCPMPSWTCNGLTLMRSRLSPGGPTYTPIARFSL